jgi:hypothetical protein
LAIRCTQGYREGGLLDGLQISGKESKFSQGGITNIVMHVYFKLEQIFITCNLDSVQRVFLNHRVDGEGKCLK